jgi:hypothetical protein
MAFIVAGIIIRMLPHLFPAGITGPSKGGDAQTRRSEPLTMDWMLLSFLFKKEEHGHDGLSLVVENLSVAGGKIFS